ncbi:hypothetical protein GCM10017044_17950 [Kordiimonas sediminis]|uniref:Uncharacterized protein n=1 Tax=Kordiimonas sediminis TaxID=1735581 RepID=A0A919E7Y6_9PROT|nr:hypothetical protein [Kordiimonas sediminis]GHF23789.1 hypothetical protein GCM10017044_17950 [Kordiimonas sediminis]
MRHVQWANTTLLLLVGLYASASLSLSAVAQDNSASPENDQTPPTATNTADTAAPIEVPVFRRDQYQNTPLPPVDASRLNPLSDSYIMLEDGAVLSLKEWVKWGANKGDINRPMSDAEQRLFLGKGARAALGHSQDLTTQNLINVAPSVNFKPGDEPAPALQLIEGLFRALILPGTPEGWRPETAGGSFSPTAKIGAPGTDAILFQRQLNEAMEWSAEDFRLNGTLQNMNRENSQAQKQDNNN